MLLRPDRGDLRIVGLYTGRVLFGVGIALLIPVPFAVLWGEYNEAASFVLASSLTLIPAFAAEWRLRTRQPATWQHGMVTSALSWLLAAFFGAVPLFLSGHYASFLDAYFDAMSGFTTSGLGLINDLDHLSRSVNLWRFITHFLGGQGLVLLVLSLFSGGGGAVGMYVGEARTDKIMPNVARTAQFIWRVSLFWFLIGTASLWAVLAATGWPLGEALYQAATLFMAAFDTGGFAPYSAGIAVYHSATFELVLGVLMVAGGLSFALHYHLWERRLGELRHNIETRLAVVTLLGLFAITAVGLLRTHSYEGAVALLRRGFFHVVSAHTGTGFANIPGRLFLTGWGVLAPAAIVFAMALGAMAGSTAGGIKLIRLGLVAKSMREQVRRLVLPANAVTLETYHSGTRQVLRDAVARSALMILLLYLALYLAGALALMFYGYPFEQAMFESTSAAANVGLSIGVIGPALEPGAKLVLILQMWIGRLEFVAVLALFGFMYSFLRGRT